MAMHNRLESHAEAVNVYMSNQNAPADKELM